MKEFNVNIINWELDNDETYLNGSQIEYTAEGIKFKNELMSPGKPLVTWYSQLNYQSKRRLPKLPLLKRGQKYQILLVATAQPENTVYLKLSFYSRFGDILQTHFIKETRGTFEYPTDAYEYRIELINAGVKTLDFVRLIIARPDIELEPEYAYQIGQQSDRNLAIFFNEPSLNVVFSEEVVKESVIFSSYQAKFSSYLSPKIKGRLSELAKENEQLAFVGCGPLSDLAAAHYAKQFKAPLFVTAIPDLPTRFENLASVFETAKVYYKETENVDVFAEKIYEKNTIRDILRVEQ